MPLDAEASAPGASPESLAERGEVAQALAAALDELDPRDRALLLLADGEDWSASELAERFGLSAGAVRTRLSRARARVRPALEALAR